MKLKIYEEKKDDEKEITLRLMKDPSEGVNLCVVDCNGDIDNFILQIRNGRIYRNPHVSKDCGFDLDERGRVMLEKEG